MSENIVKTKLRNIDIPILTAFLSAPIFIPVSKKIDRESVVFKKFEIFSTKNIKIKAKVPLLDMTVDFPIFAVAIKELSKTPGTSVRIEENKFLKLLGINRNNINKKNKFNIDRRLESMISSVITIELFSDAGEFIEKSYINLFSSAKWSREDGYFEFKFNSDIYKAYDNIKWKAIDLEYYQSIRTEYAKALFLFYESHSDKLIPIEKEKLIERLDLGGYSRANNITAKINKAHQQLKEIGFLSDFKIVKDRVTKKTYYKVAKVKKKDRVFGI
tara:strand:+ start:115 stop:933 length:819 start_codon:yes stop_codon:yes gene_type:complete